MDIEGVEDVAGDFDRASRTIGNRSGRVIADTARKIQADAKSAVAVGTGKTRDSIEATDGEGGPLGNLARRERDRLEAEIGPTHFVGRFLEFGTSRQSPRPFLFPAADRHVDGMADDLADEAGEI